MYIFTQPNTPATTEAAKAACSGVGADKAMNQSATWYRNTMAMSIMNRGTGRKRSMITSHRFTVVLSLLLMLVLLSAAGWGLSPLSSKPYSAQ